MDGLGGRPGGARGARRLWRGRRATDADRAVPHRHARAVADAARDGDAAPARRAGADGDRRDGDLADASRARATTTLAKAGAAATPGATATANQPPRPLTFSGENAYRHVEELSIGIGVRAAGAEGEAKAADFIADQFAALGYAVTRQPFSITTFLDNGSTLTLMSSRARSSRWRCTTRAPGRSTARWRSAAWARRPTS